MRRGSACLALVSLLLLLVASQAGAIDARVKNLLIIIDSSASMSTRTVDGVQKLYAAKIALFTLINELSDNLNVGLMSYGDYDHDPCDRVVIMLPVVPLNRAAMWKVTGLISAKGLTPLADSLKRGAQYLRGIEGKSLIMVITDGQDTCAGDPVSVASGIGEEYGIEVMINVIGIGVPPEEEAQLKAIARAGGGKYHLVHTQDELVGTASQIANQNLAIQAGEEGTLIINFKGPSSVSGLALYNQGTDIRATGGSIWKSFKNSFSTKLKPGRYRLEFREHTKKFPTIIDNVVINTDGETVVNVDATAEKKKRRRRDDD